MTPPGWDTNPSRVSSQQTLVLIYLPRKDGKLSLLWWKRISHKHSNLGRAGIELGTLWSESRDLTNCTNHARLFVSHSYDYRPNWTPLGPINRSARCCACLNLQLITCEFWPYKKVYLFSVRHAIKNF